MFGDGALAFQEFAMGEPLPLAVIHSAVLDFLRGREDAVLQGAQAVNAYVSEPRMTQDVDILSLDAEKLAENLKSFLNQHFHISVRVREVQEGLGFRVYQVQEPKNRHLADIRAIDQLPPRQRISEVLVLAPEELIASKVVAYHNRRGRPKAFTDLRDLAVLLLTFPGLKSLEGSVRERLASRGASEEVLAIWGDLATREFRMDEDDEFETC